MFNQTDFVSYTCRLCKSLCQSSLKPASVTYLKYLTPSYKMTETDVTDLEEIEQGLKACGLQEKETDKEGSNIGKSLRDPRSLRM